MSDPSYADSIGWGPKRDAVHVGEGIAYDFTLCPSPRDRAHRHEIGCLWVWHDCAVILGPTTVMPGARYGWRPTGVGAHTLVELEPLTLHASLIWPECGRHGFLTGGKWRDV